MKSTETKKQMSPVEIYKRYGLVIILAVICVIASIVSDVFLTSGNILSVLRQIAVITIICCGEQIVLVQGDTDLSAGSCVALCGCVSATLINMGAGWLPAFMGGLAMGALTGFVNGMIIAHFRIPSFIMTLGMMEIARGAVLAYTGSAIIPGMGALKVLGAGKIFGFFPVPVLVTAVCVLITWVILSKMPFGRYLYALGGNQDAAVAAGINVRRTRTVAFMINGILIGLAGIVLAARLDSGYPAAGDGYEFDAITACIIGGTSFSGGTGTIWGAVFGSLIIGVINNCLNLCNVPSTYQQITKGLLIVIAVIIDVQSKKRRD